MRLLVSVVTYRSDAEQFDGTLRSLCEALAYAKERLPSLSCDLYIVENDCRRRSNQAQAEEFFSQGKGTELNRIVIKSMGTNLGYGKGHNAAFSEGSPADYYMVLNPDVRLAQDSIYVGLLFMAQDPSVALLSPAAVDGKGVRLHLCKRPPRVFDLLLRGFAPGWVRNRFMRRLSHYEMHELSESDSAVYGVPIVSGCCMLLRHKDYVAVDGFDDRFFLYFEDFDLSLRIRESGQLVYLPAMKIVHLGGNAAKKGLWHIGLFVASGFKFYCRYGWRWFRY